MADSDRGENNFSRALDSLIRRVRQTASEVGDQFPYYAEDFGSGLQLKMATGAVDIGWECYGRHIDEPDGSSTVHSGPHS